MARAYEELGKKEYFGEELEALGRGALRKAVVEGDVDNGSVMSGQIAGLVKKNRLAVKL